MKIFDIVNSIFNKTYLNDLSDYNPHIINKALAQYPDTILFSNEMNMNHAIDDRWQYDYFYHAIRKGKRWTKWYKPGDDTDLKAVMIYFKMNQKKAKEAISILSPEQLYTIKKKIKEVGEYG